MAPTGSMKERCFLVYALAPEGTTAREANDRLNEYVADSRRGLSVWHDHFVGDHGGAVVLDVRSEDERALLDDPGPLAGWQISVHPLAFSLAAVGFAAQTSFTLERYRGVSLEELAAAELTILASGGGRSTRELRRLEEMRAGHSYPDTRDCSARSPTTS